MHMRAAISLCRQVNKATPLNPRRVWRQRVQVCVQLLIAGIGAFVLIFAGGISTGAQAQSLGENDAKAAFVLKLVNFVQWPSDASQHSATDDLVIGFIGADATSDALQRQTAGKSVNGRK